METKEQDNTGMVDEFSHKPIYVGDRMINEVGDESIIIRGVTGEYLIEAISDDIHWKRLTLLDHLDGLKPKGQ